MTYQTSLVNLLYINMHLIWASQHNILSQREGIFTEYYNTFTTIYTYKHPHITTHTLVPMNIYQFSVVNWPKAKLQHDNPPQSFVFPFF